MFKKNFAHGLHQQTLVWSFRFTLVLLMKPMGETSTSFILCLSLFISVSRAVYYWVFYKPVMSSSTSENKFHSSGTILYIKRLQISSDDRAWATPWNYYSNEIPKRCTVCCFWSSLASVHAVRSSTVSTKGHPLLYIERIYKMKL